ncbi:MurR/RpiR family transcriptional regulator [Jannaschia sp. W003]|uniref:MurR/RpiR family transcriptional regulator n=1 Tax=Jannaschia sp. W003 TaxID=2867012 RepID=UPI0021A5F1C0|nr:MurR/RpiR family transcriptional regulator [Jannaschia sp. W003]UWQ19970.1 MurR/RpiR family transcriptional regulator [Jannaschia sp. W003]
MDGEPTNAAPETVAALIARLDGDAERLPRRLRQCAEYTRRHLHLVAVSTVSQMAGAAGVAPSVYVRFCQALGFPGYSAMQDLLRAGVASFRPDYDTRIAALREGGAVATGRLLADFAEAGHRSLVALSDTDISEALDRMARGMGRARVVHLAGFRRAFALVGAMAYLLGRLDIPAALHTGAGKLDAAATMVPGDVLLAVTFAPFSEETVALAAAAAARGVTVYGLTDSEACPLAPHAAELVVAAEAEVAGFRSMAASMTIAATLAVAAGAARRDG